MSTASDPIDSSPGGTRRSSATSLSTLGSVEISSLSAVMAYGGQAPDLLGSCCVMDMGGWKQALADIGITGIRITPLLIEEMYFRVQPSSAAGSLMVFTEFCEGVASLALVLDPSPFQPPVTKVDAAMRLWMRRNE